MAKSFRTQTDLFTKTVAPLALVGAERQKAVALLQTLLTEAVAKPIGQTPNSDKKEAGDE
jgi:hypothetical protein